MGNAVDPLAGLRLSEAVVGVQVYLPRRMVGDARASLLRTHHLKTLPRLALAQATNRC